ncbi:hypothetical protein GPECTOR_6g545 [Gonium pectorale]|uniref:30S ribosomal protein 3, chloroplastic n=1 Tax=Gonium pectorale TaxID=33097 RepID=A0A150GVB3_GONPE|nr:hypothetical protein GPECTOR_6g545 [Gonium pectorale]|eukprot:KXZ53628.1 hypothetical protein GPECTOR_6g545 [Gonium pectorale]
MLASFRATARPFTSARPAARTPLPVCIRSRVAVRVAAGDALAEKVAGEPTVTDEELSLLLEEEEADELDVIYASAAAEDDFADDDDVDEVMQAAMEAADGLNDGVDALTVAAISAELDGDAEDKEAGARAVEALLADALSGDEPLSEETLASITSGVPEAELEGEAELEDFVPAMNSDRYEERPLSADDKDAIAPYKLSKGELRNLLPSDWDQINTDFFSNKKAENIPLPEFRLNLLWNVNTLGIAIDQVYSRGQVSPLTEYFFWPRQDAWEDLRQNLEARPWISERDRIVLLNRMTEIINYWQEEDQKPPIEAARAKFTDCLFIVA